MMAGLRGDQVSPDLAAKAVDLVTRMTARKISPLPQPASAAELAAAEAPLGFPLPAPLRRVYGEVADGGFGPAGGLLSVDAVARTYAAVRASSPGAEGCPWPERLLPVLDQDGAYTCVDAPSGRVVEFDPQELLEVWDPDDPDERAAQRGWKRSLRDSAPDVAIWLERWIGTPTFEERISKRVAASNLAEAKRACARIAAMTPDERRAMGLPEIGWEKVVWGGLGLEED